MKQHCKSAPRVKITTLVLVFLYNFFFPLIFILMLPGYLPRMFRRGGYHDSFFQRFGIFDHKTEERIGRQRLWVHAVSVGEVFIALKFIRNFHERHPEIRFLLSVTTTTGLEIARGEASDWLEPIANPLDFFFIINPVLDHFQPSALIMVEGDLWIQRLWHCRKKGIPTAIISARLSPRSEERFRKFRSIIAPVFNLLDFIGFPSKGDQERWHRLGIYAQHSSVTGNIKFDQVAAARVMPPHDRAEIFSQLRWNPQDPLLLAGSTADIGEEEEVLKAWLLLRSEFKSLRLVIVPRHVERRHETSALFQKYNIQLTLRSSNSLTPADALLLDTTGELKSWYSLATIVFIGKSLGTGSARGGQNLVEPLLLGRPVLVGPFMENFEPLTSRLLRAHGIMLVHHGKEIAATTKQLLLYPEEAAKMVARACKLLEGDQGATERTCYCIETLLS
ncbi:MAG: 3-deoxy-D-manno-octulosonic acid transferase [Chthoniobacterales bacterium]